MNELRCDRCNKTYYPAAGGSAGQHFPMQLDSGWKYLVVVLCPECSHLALKEKLLDAVRCLP